MELTELKESLELLKYARGINHTRYYNIIIGTDLINWLKHWLGLLR